MSRDLKVLAPRPPRGTLLGTGKDVPRGQSLRGRLLICHLDRGALDWTALTSAQQRADGGHYAQALAGFVIHLAGRPELLDSHAKRVAPPGAAAGRRHAQPHPDHRRRTDRHLGGAGRLRDRDRRAHRGRADRAAGPRRGRAAHSGRGPGR
jgi:hypothetical protein